MAQLEFMADGKRYSIRVQLSTPQLERQVVWSPSVFISTPDRGQGEEEEVLRSFLSILKDEDSFLMVEFAFSTLGAATKFLNLSLLCMC